MKSKTNRIMINLNKMINNCEMIITLKLLLMSIVKYLILFKIINLLSDYIHHIIKSYPNLICIF
jgi:hypothetical protein